MLSLDSATYIPGERNKDLWVYNGLDCCLTLEVFNELAPRLDAKTAGVYAFERACLVPAMEMMLRGILVDPHHRRVVQEQLTAKIAWLQARLNRLAQAVWDKDLNPNSPKQLIEFFYTTMGLPVQYKKDAKGQRVPTCDRDALEKIQDYFYAKPIINHIFAIKNVKGIYDVVRKGIDADGRMRFSLNVGATETGRWSSSKNVFGGGTNLQNITEEIRRMFISDDGYLLAYLDLEQAESRCVAYLSNDPAYIFACESGDLHTYCARLLWPGLNWSKSNDLKTALAEDRKIAETIFYRHFSNRDMSKRGGHLSNYDGKAYTMAKHLHIPRQLAEDFQSTYFTTFHGIKTWQLNVAAELQQKKQLSTPLGRVRQFFDRLWEDSTVREAIAFKPQSMVGDIMNIGLLRMYRKSLDKTHVLSHLRLHGQVHDAGLLQFPQHLTDEIIPAALECMAVPIPFGDKTMLIPADAKIGYNWGKQDPKRKMFLDGNPDGMRTWEKGKPLEPRKTLLETLI